MMHFAHVSNIKEKKKKERKKLKNLENVYLMAFVSAGKEFLSLRSKSGFVTISKNNSVPTKGNSKQVFATNSFSLKIAGIFSFFKKKKNFTVEEQASNFVNNNSFIFELKHHVSP